MPANNRMSTSDSLRTSEVWKNAVGYDPYASVDEQADKLGDEAINEKAKGLFALARLTGNSSSVTPGACRKCGQIGHLSFQCRNYMSFGTAESMNRSAKSESSDEEEESDSEPVTKKQPRAKEAKISSSSDSDSEEDKKRKNRKHRKSKRASKKRERSKDKKRSRHS